VGGKTLSVSDRKQMKSAVNSFSSLSSSPALECAGWLMIKTNIPRRDVTSQILVTLILQIFWHSLCRKKYCFSFAPAIHAKLAHFRNWRDKVWKFWEKTCTTTMV
jgi:hypothetical protein